MLSPFATLNDVRWPRAYRPTTFLFTLIFLVSIFSAETIKAEVVGISDGDTITVLRNKEQIKVRLAGIDTPEKGQDFGTKAREFIGSRLFRKEVEVLVKDTDRYGRTVGLVYYDGGRCMLRFK